MPQRAKMPGVTPSIHRDMPAVRMPRGSACRAGVLSRRTRRKPMHGNGRYVKLAWIGLLSALALPAPARAEIVSPTTGPGLLAVAGDGSPRVAFLSGRDVVVARRTAAGWTFARAGRAPGQNPVLSGLVVDQRAPHAQRRDAGHDDGRRSRHLRVAVPRRRA